MRLTKYDGPPPNDSAEPSSTLPVIEVVQMVKLLVNVSAQPPLASVIGPLTAPAGTVVVSVVSLTTLKVAVTLLLNLTPVMPVNPVPEMVTVPPIAPAEGSRLAIAGQPAPPLIVKLASEMSKKTLPTASTLMRAVELFSPAGTVT